MWLRLGERLLNFIDSAFSSTNPSENDSWQRHHAVPSFFAFFGRNWKHIM